MVYTKDILADSVKFGTMFLVAQYLVGGSLADKAWQQSSLLTIVGFAIYQLFARDLVGIPPTGPGSSTQDMVINDLAKNGVMLVASRLLAGGSLTDMGWIKTAIGLLVGFVVYDILVAKYVQGHDLSSHAGIAASIDDAAKFGIMFVVQQLVTGGALSDKKWAMASLASLIGFSAYNLGTSRIVDAL